MIGSKILSAMSGMLAGALILYSGYVLYDSFYTQHQAYAATTELMDYKPTIIDDGSVPLAGADMLASINEDYRAWLTLYDTNIDYPVVQGENDLYYSSHDIHRQSSLTGSIYLASGNAPDLSDSYNLIYGHHMDNGAMFGGLDSFADEEYFNSHRSGMLVSDNGAYDLTTFAVVTTDAYDSAIYSTGDRMEEVVAYVAGNDGTVIYEESAVEEASKVLAMSTCASAETSGRLVVLAVMTPSGAAGVVPETDGGSGAEEVIPGGTADVIENISGSTEGTGSADGLAATSGADTLSAADAEEIDDMGMPLAGFFDRFQPTGGTHGTHAWALINLICLLVTLYLFLPLLQLKAKFGRKGMMKTVNEEETEKINAEIRLAAALAGADPDKYEKPDERLVYQVKAFVRRFRFGIVAELILSVGAVVAFILTENMRLPMILIDKWTPLMILLLGLVWLADVALIRYRGEEEAEDVMAADAAEVAAIEAKPVLANQ